MRRGFTSAILVFALAAASGCRKESAACECDGDKQKDDLCVISENQLPDSVETDAGIWSSAPWENADWLGFPADAELQIAHSLGRAPVSVLVYLSFDSRNESAFLAAGDLARVTSVTKKSVTIKNNTKQCFYLRIVLE